LVLGVRFQEDWNCFALNVGLSLESVTGWQRSELPVLWELRYVFFMIRCLSGS